MCVKAPEKLFLYQFLMNYCGFLVYFMAFFMKMHYVANFPQTACCDGRSLPYGDIKYKSVGVHKKYHVAPECPKASRLAHGGRPMFQVLTMFSTCL